MRENSLSSAKNPRAGQRDLTELCEISRRFMNTATGLTLHFDSWLLDSTKRNFIRNTISTIHRRCSNDEVGKSSVEDIRYAFETKWVSGGSSDTIFEKLKEENLEKIDQFLFLIDVIAPY